MANPRVVVLDDYFPRLETGFRVAEFTWLLEHGEVAEVMSSTTPFEEVAAPFKKSYPIAAARVAPYDPTRFSEFDLAYILFANNAIAFLPDLVAAALPFVLTLYPGGGLTVGERGGSDRLDAIYGSGLLRHVITTQPVVTEYLTEHYYDSGVPITEVIGLTVNPSLFRPGAGLRVDYFGSGKPRLDICFVAYKYTPDGADKGYPQFLDIVRGLRAAGVPLRAHVVGGFQLGDLPDADLLDDLRFYPPLATDKLREFYLEMDVVASPNSPNVLGAGAFDGFPTGAAIEAALAGVAMLCSDELNQNRCFRDGRSILIEKPNADAMARRLLRLFVEPDGVRRVAQAGLREARRYYAPEAQLGPRVAALRSAATALSEGGAIDTGGTRQPEADQ